MFSDFSDTEAVLNSILAPLASEASGATDIGGIDDVRGKFDVVIEGVERREAPA